MTEPVIATGLPKIERQAAWIDSPTGRPLPDDTTKIAGESLSRNRNDSTTSISSRRAVRNGDPFYYPSLQRQPLIRLLKLDETKVTDNRPRGFIITTVSLARAPPYYALSYCWGSCERDAYIVCNGKYLGVTTQLSQGIRELQDIPALAGSWVWIDQISINQDDPDERSHQVSLMRDIYSRSVRTLVWLGPSDGPCEGGYRLAERLAKICQSNKYSTSTMGWRMRHPKRSLSEEYDENLRRYVPRISSQPWQELRHMLSKPWFSRIWVIQEVDLSREAPLLVYGGKARDLWPPLLAGRWIGGPRAAAQVEASSSPTQEEQKEEELSLQPPPLPNYCLGDLFMILSSRHRWSLEALLLHTLDHEATDSRDHIFALLGIAMETATTGSSSPWPSELQPDYREKPGVVFQRATSFIIAQSGRLTPLLLLAAGSTTKTQEHNHVDCCSSGMTKKPQNSKEQEEEEETMLLPSWVPDYGAKPTLPCAMGVRLSSKTRAVEVTIPWRASRHFLADPQVTMTTTNGDGDDNDHEAILTLEGCEVEQIIWTSTTANNDSLARERDSSQLFRWLNGAAGALSALFEIFDTDELYEVLVRDFFESFINTVSAVYNDGTRRPHSRDVLEYMDLHDSIAYPESNDGKAHQSHFQRMRSHFLFSTISGSEPSKVCSVSELIDFFLTHPWYIFLTKTGRLGIGKSTCSEGDIVTVLWGGAMPFILRPSGPNYTMLGPCVVLKWMNGLAVDGWRSGELDLTVYSIE